MASDQVFPAARIHVCSALGSCCTPLLNSRRYPCETPAGVACSSCILIRHFLRHEGKILSLKFSSDNFIVGVVWRITSDDDDDDDYDDEEEEKRKEMEKKICKRVSVNPGRGWLANVDSSGRLIQHKATSDQVDQPEGRTSSPEFWGRQETSREFDLNVSRKKREFYVSWEKLRE
ncbi:hypothetical protein RUM44_004524 [Polyplax serrata]|uniref:Uncharacterized protein n=1 Tax=Polyplax serrata TaxID=468196 RepID=A0ABR1B345_POLSC